MTRTGQAWEQHIHENWFYLSVMLSGALKEIHEQGKHCRMGFLYLGYAKKLRALKFGGTNGCPICRMKGVHKVRKKRVILTPLAISFSDDWRTNEQRLLGALGTPKFGNEWFEPEKRFSWLVKHKLVFPITILEREAGVNMALAQQGKALSLCQCTRGPTQP